MSINKPNADEHVSFGDETLAALCYLDSVSLDTINANAKFKTQKLQKDGDIISTLHKSGYKSSRTSQHPKLKHENVSVKVTHNRNETNTSFFKPNEPSETLSTSNKLESETVINAKNNSINGSVASENDVSLLCSQEKVNLSVWGLPNQVLKQYKSFGVVKMFPWQVQCLCNANVLEGGNLVYSAPTSAGKTLVAEILAIKTVLERKKKVVIILPFVSVVREKMFYFQDLLSGVGVRVAGLMGNHKIHGGFKNLNIAICTIEKANSLINRLMEDDLIKDLGAIVVDELHLLGDPHRGYLLELLLTKILYMCKTDKNVSIQIIGMSATLPNLDLLAKWLNAALFKTDFRPIPLEEQLKIDTVIYDKNLKPLRTVQPEIVIQDDTDQVVYLCLETILGGHSTLIFCPTKSWCETLSQHVAKEFHRIGISGHAVGLKLREQLNTSAIVEALEQLKQCPVGLDSILKRTVAFGVAFHHAGLTVDERDIIEGLFRGGVLRVLVATSTLSSGVNLPARRVIIRSPIFHGRTIETQTYQQMIGRAGRMGRDSAGESLLICNKGERRIGQELIQADLKPIESCLGFGELSVSLKRAVLEVIASGVAHTPSQLECYINCTLLAASESELENPIKICVDFLHNNELIRLQHTEDNLIQYLPTPLGTACLAASISPDDGLHLFKELQKARQCFVLETELHLVYQVTPLNIAAQWGNLDWFEVLSLWEQLPQSMRRVGELVGVEETFMVRALRGTVNIHGNKQVARINRQKMAVHRRFYTALALQDLINEVPLTEVAAKFKCSRGMLQSLQQTASTFAGMVTAFCKRLGWDNMELLFSQFQERLQFGIHRELCDLMKLDSLNGIRARALFNAGICTLSSLASANVCEVENALHKATPFQSSKEIDGETRFDTTKRNEMKTVWVTGKHGLTERDAAIFLIKEAREYLQTELGLADAKWDSITTSNYSSLSNSGSEIQKNCSGDFRTEVRGGNALESQGYKECDNNTPSQYILVKKNESTDIHEISPEKAQSPSRNSESFTITSSLKFTSNDEGAEDKAEHVCIPNKNVLEIASISDDDSLEHNLAINLSSLNISLKDENISNQISEKISVVSEVSEENSIKITGKSNDENTEKSFGKPENCHEISIEMVYSSTKYRNNSELLSPPAVNDGMYRSPSLFGDSLVMDSQLCDVLDCNNSPDKYCPVVLDIKMSQEEVFKLTPHSPVQVMPSENFVINTQLCQILDCNNTPISRNSKTALKTQWSMSSKKKEDRYSKPQHTTDSDSISSSLLDKAFGTYYDFHDEYNTVKEDLKSQITGRKKKSANNMKETDMKKLRLCEDSKEVEASPIKEISTVSILKSQNSKQSIQENSHTRNTLIRSRLKFNKIVQFSSSSEGDYSDDDKSSIVQSSQKSLCGTSVKGTCRKLRISKLQSPSDKSTPLKKFGDQKRCKKKLVKKIGMNEEKSKKVSSSEYHSMDIITVSGHKKLFKAFQTEVSITQHISLAIVCEPYKPPATLKKLIGLKVLGRKRKPCDRSTTDSLCVYADCMVTGFAVCCGGKDVYFIQFPHQDIEDDSPIPLHERLNLLKSITSGTQRIISMFDLKQHYKVLHQCCNITLVGNACDPKVADWLLNPEGREKTLQAVTLAYSPNLVEVADMAGKTQGVGSPSLDIENLVSPQIRACSEALVVWHVVETQKKELAQNNLDRLYEEVEMPVLLCLAKMEITGIGFSIAEAEHLKEVLTKEISSLEKRAYKLANHSFSLTSTNDIAKVLYSELRLNPGKMFGGQKPGTGKEALVHLKHQHPLPNIILQWRKLNVVLTKTVYPLLNAGSSERMYGRCVTHTATGRISMHEPNLQNIARDFDIFTEDNSSLLVSMRLAFVPKSGMVLVSADYSQLELRLLAHLSQDSTLCCILRSGRDVFRGIASNWNKIPESQVTDELRQRAKQVCYGMIYGIGVKALADQLEVDENEAAIFMETFKTSYPGVRKYVEETIQRCRSQGYVETVHKRKRFLPGINNTNPAIRAQAERQAVNSTIQGSAADIAKKAMVLVDASLVATFSSNGSVSMGTRKRDLMTSQRSNMLSVAHLVLHIHDEMIYEVSRDHLLEVASIIKCGMESAAALSVALPVKVKSGNSWGSLQDLEI